MPLSKFWHSSILDRGLHHVLLIERRITSFSGAENFFALFKEEAHLCLVRGIETLSPSFRYQTFTDIGCEVEYITAYLSRKVRCESSQSSFAIDLTHLADTLDIFGHRVTRVVKDTECFLCNRRKRS